MKLSKMLKGSHAKVVAFLAAAALVLLAPFAQAQSTNATALVDVVDDVSYIFGYTKPIIISIGVFFILWALVKRFTKKAS